MTMPPAPPTSPATTGGAARAPPTATGSPAPRGSASPPGASSTPWSAPRHPGGPRRLRTDRPEGRPQQDRRAALRRVTAVDHRCWAAGLRPLAPRRGHWGGGRRPTRRSARQARRVHGQQPDQHLPRRDGVPDRVRIGQQQRRRLFLELLDADGGETIMLVVGLVLIVVGIALAWRGLKTDFEEQLEDRRDEPRTYAVVRGSARSATWPAAWSSRCRVAGHQGRRWTTTPRRLRFRRALKSLAEAPFGKFLLARPPSGSSASAATRSPRSATAGSDPRAGERA